MTDDRWLRDRERQIESFGECRSIQAEERDRHTAPRPPLIQTGPTTIKTKKKKLRGTFYVLNVEHKYRWNRKILFNV